MASMNSQCMTACSQLAVMNTYQLTSAERSSGGTRRHDLVERPAGQLRHRHDLQSLGAQSVDDARQRRHRVRSVAAGIVQQHDLPARLGIGVGHAVHDPLHDQIGGRPLPVVGIDPQADRHVAERLRNLDRRDLARAWSARHRRRTAA